MIKKNYPSLSPMHHSLKCIHCSSHPSNGFIQLKHSAIIEPGCLREVQHLANDQETDQEIRPIYQHIISLVMKCTLCEHTIDGFKLSLGNGSEDNPICSKCFRIPEGAENSHYGQHGECMLCSIKLYGEKYNSAVHLDGCLVCQRCFAQQYKQENVAKWEVKPEVQNDPFKPLKEFAQKFKHPEVKPSPKKVNPFMKQADMANQLFESPAKRDPLQRKPFSMRYVSPPIPPRFMRTSKKEESDEKPKVLPLPDKKEETITCSETRLCVMCEQERILTLFQALTSVPLVCEVCVGGAKQVKIQHIDKPVVGLFEDSSEDEEWFGMGLSDLFSDEEGNPKKKKSKRRVQQNDDDDLEDALKVLAKKKTTVYELKECKICFNAQSTMINLACRHLMMCDECFVKVRCKNGNKKTVPCPVCTKEGEYQKYFIPIYV